MEKAKITLCKIITVLKNSKIFFLVLFLINAAGAFFYGLTFQNVNDGFWHIKVGEYILKYKVIPHYDIFSWYGIWMKFKWTSHEWLFGIIAYLVYSIKGFLSISIFVGTINLISMLLVYTLSIIRCKNKWLSLLIAFGFTINCSIIVTYRPILITIPLLLICCILLEYKKFIPALVLMIIGINIHGGIYPIYIFIFAYYTLFNNYKYLILCLLGILINPYTYEIYEYTYKLMFNNGNANNYIMEWHTTAMYDYRFCFAILVLCMFIYMLSKVKFRDLFFSGAFILLSFTAVRQVVFVYTLVLPLLSPYIICAANEFTNRYLNKFKLYLIVCGKLDINRKSFFKFVITVLLILMCSVSITTDIAKFIKNEDTLFSISKSQCPVDAADYILKNPNIKSSHLLSNYNDSQYLIFRGVPTFVDSREDLFTYNFNHTYVYLNYMSAFVDLSSPEILLKQYDIDYILVNVNTSIYKVLENKPMLFKQYQDPNYVIFKVNKKVLNNYYSY